MPWLSTCRYLSQSVSGLQALPTAGKSNLQCCCIHQFCMHSVNMNFHSFIINPGMTKNLFQTVRFSDLGATKRVKEEAMYMLFLDLLYECKGNGLWNELYPVSLSNNLTFCIIYYININIISFHLFPYSVQKLKSHLCLLGRFQIFSCCEYLPPQEFWYNTKYPFQLDLIFPLPPHMPLNWHSQQSTITTQNSSKTDDIWH